MSALLFDDGARRSEPLAAAYLQRHAARLNPGERRYVERMLAAHFDLHRVVDTDPGTGIVLHDLVDDVEFDVEERTASHTLQIGDVLAVRIMEGPRGVAHIDGGVFVFDELTADEMLRKRRTAPRTRSIAILRTYVETLIQPPPQIRTRDGDAFEPYEAYYDILDRDALCAALEGRTDTDRNGDEFVWLEGHSILASLELRGNRLIVRTFSRERADRVRELLETVAPNAVRYRLARVEDINVALEQARRGGAKIGGKPAKPTPEQLAVMSAYLEQHYRDWIDTPIPALGNRTPRRAAALKTVRPTLIALLRDMQADENRKPAALGPRYDFGWMYDELGLET